jgi:hypothetical protein
MTELQTLKTLPNQKPPYASDIYGLDTAIMYQGEDGYMWSNGGPEGCGSRQGPHVTDEQKQQFKQLVDRIVGVASVNAKVV